MKMIATKNSLKEKIMKKFKSAQNDLDIRMLAVF